MGLIPQVKCRRCGEVYSSARNRCPNCGTRRVSQSTRSPATTPGSVKGTAAYSRTDANIKWQLAFGLILVLAVILAVVVMVTTTLSAQDAGVVRATPTPYVPPADTVPTIDPGPTPSPTPEPKVESIRIYNYTNDITSESKWPQLRDVSDAEYRMKLTAMVMPQDIMNPQVTWTCSDPECFSLTPDPTDPNVMWGQIIKAKPGGVQITAECYGVAVTITVYLVNG